MEDLSLPTLRDGLERRYQACLPLEQSFDLIIALHDYIHYINEHPIIDYLFTEKIQKGARDLFGQIKKAEEKTVKELVNVYKDLNVIVKRNKITDQEVLNSLSEFEHYQKGHYTSSRGKAESMHDELRDAISAISNSENRELVSKYIIPPETSQERPRFGKVNLSGTFSSFQTLKERFRKQAEVSAWGALLRMSMTKSCRT